MLTHYSSVWLPGVIETSLLYTVWAELNLRWSNLFPSCQVTVGLSRNTWELGSGEGERSRVSHLFSTCLFNMKEVDAAAEERYMGLQRALVHLGSQNSNIEEAPAPHGVLQQSECAPFLGS